MREVDRTERAVRVESQIPKTARQGSNQPQVSKTGLPRNWVSELYNFQTIGYQNFATFKSVSLL